MTSHRTLNRRSLVIGAAAGALSGRALAAAPQTRDLGLAGGGGLRDVTRSFPTKGRMILQRTRPPLLETPFEVFDDGALTPNDQFYVRWHWAGLPPVVDPRSFRLTVRGEVQAPLSLSLETIKSLPRFEIVAVNQCSGNSRGLFNPRVPGAQWGDGAMGNARWTGVRLRDILDRAGVRPDARFVRFRGLDEPTAPEAPAYAKSVSVDHARDGEVMVAWAMNGQPLPYLNGFPLRLVVPGWYATYWVKTLSDIEVLSAQDDNYWMTKAYLVPDTPGGMIAPGQQGVKTVPITRMVPRSFFTGPAPSAAQAGRRTVLRGFAFGGDCGVARVELSGDGGRSWSPTTLGPDLGAYSFRRWSATAIAPGKTDGRVLVRCTNTAGVAQPLEAGWNGSGFMRNAVEHRVVGQAEARP